MEGVWSTLLSVMFMNPERSSTKINRQTFREEFREWLQAAFRIVLAVRNWLISAPRVWLLILAPLTILQFCGNKIAAQVLSFFFGWIFLVFVILGLFYAPAFLGAMAGKIVGGTIRWFKRQSRRN
jgi:hypothetical protein